MSKKRPIIATFEKSENFILSGLKKSTYGMREPRKYPVLPPSPCGSKKVTTLLDRWVKDWIITLLEVPRLPSHEDQKYLIVLPLSWRLGYHVEQRIALGRLWKP